MNDDGNLLRLYAENGSQAAFTELVHRHVNLVYGAALRRTGGDPHHASDVTQQVFAALARNAGKLSRHTVLQAWLHTATRNASLNLVTSELRRKIRESQAAEVGASTPETESATHWKDVRPLLDGAIDELPEPDRAAVVLRFLEHREYSKIGLVLGLSPDAARMRTERALEKLRTLLARRGVTSTATALAALVANQPMVAAPTAVVSALTSSSLITSGAPISIKTSLTYLMTTKIVSTAVVMGALGLGIGVFLGRNGSVALANSNKQLSFEEAAQSRTIATLRESDAALRAEIDRLNSANARLNATNSQLSASNTQLEAAKAATPVTATKNLSIGMTPRELKQGILNNLRQIDAARAQYKLEKGGTDPNSIEDLVGDKGYIRRVRTVAGEDYSGLSMATGQMLTVTAPDGTTVTYDPAGANTTQITDPMTDSERGQAMLQSIGPAMQQALIAYRANNQGQDPTSPSALAPYFANPQDAATFAQANAALRRH